MTSSKYIFFRISIYEENMNILSLSTVDESSCLRNSDDQDDDNKQWKQKNFLLKDNNTNFMQDGEDQDDQSIWRRIISWIFNIFFPCKKKENP